MVVLYLFEPFQVITLRQNIQKCLDISSLKRPHDQHLSADTPTVRKKSCYESLCEDHSYERQSPYGHMEDARLALSTPVPFSWTYTLEDAKTVILRELNTKLDSLASLCESGSILYQDATPENLFSGVFEELRTRVPFLFSVLTVATQPTCVTPYAHGIPQMLLCFLYAVIMRTRSERCNAIQKFLTAVCLRYHAGNQVNSSAGSVNCVTFYFFSYFDA